MLAVIGGGLGLLFSWGALSLLVSFAARFTPRAREIHMDGWVLGFTFLGGRVDQPAFWKLRRRWRRESQSLARSKRVARSPTIGLGKAPDAEPAHCGASRGFLPAADWRGTDVCAAS